MEQPLWQRRDCVSAEVDGSLVLLDLDTLQYHSLNETAASVWNLLDKPKTADQLTESLRSTYNVSAEACRTSVDRLLTHMQESGLVSVAEK